jgi:hypothetical protein
MNRRFAVLGLAVAVSGSIVAGQTAPTTAPVPITPAPGGFSNAYPRPTQAQQGLTTFRVESVGPQRTRIHVTTDGVEQWTLEASGFTVTTQASGTAITTSGPVTMATSDGKTISVGALTLQFAPSGRVSGSTLPVGNR